MPQFLMCSPQFFDIEYEINPWMHEDNQVDTDRAREQWENLKKTYLDLGFQVEEVEPAKGWPDMVFTANAGLVLGDKKVILSSFRYSERQGEEPFFRAWFEQNGWEVTQLDVPFEGQGEAFLWNDQVLTGFGFRSDEHTASSLELAIGKKVIQLELVNPKFYHLDMALAPIASDLIAYNPAAFSDEAKEKIKDLGVELIEIDEADSNAFGANLVPIGDTIIMAQGTTKLNQQLKDKGYKVIELDMSEFRKSGGGVRCLTLDL